MKTLYIMRHAKSSWKDPDLMDHQRPLNKRGKEAAFDMGHRLKARNVRLDIIVSSDARRAMDTAVAIANVLRLPPKMIHPLSNLPTAGIIELRFKMPSWRHIHGDYLDFSFFDFPRNKKEE